ncbi:unnamed protein product [Hyaloperonospora brassicae]|uniref:RxLR effector candidate protein n=1 Tax=Hyaloperonospora brassicae TaxID=162125 RepID=A0AAV0UZ07_HYABA|nr:unnamed protein product [Hyaloperonospora brassicae]
MRWLCHVLTALILHAWGTAQQLDEDSNHISVTDLTATSSPPRTTKTPSSIALRPLTPHGSVFNMTKLELQDDEEKTVPSSLFSDFIHKLGGIVRNIMPTKTGRMVKSVVAQMTKGGLVRDETILHLDEFVQLLGQKLKTSDHRWDYYEVVTYLTNTGKEGGNNLPRVQPTELMKAFHSLRGISGMEKHADGLQRALADRFRIKLQEPTLWLELDLAPEIVVNNILLSGGSEKYLKIAGAQDKKTATKRLNHELGLVQQYIADYQGKHAHYSDDMAKSLMNHLTTQAKDLDRSFRGRRSEKQLV